MSDPDWPFDQPRNCAVVTLRRIVFGGRPILYVSHDLDDHGWQFMDGERVEAEDAAVVCLEQIVERDPSVLELATMPPGWVAVRDSVRSEWRTARRGE